MEVTLPRSVLAQKLALAAGAISGKPSNQTLSYVKLTVHDDGEATLEGCSSGVELRIKASLGKVEGDAGSCLLPPGRLTAIVRESSDETLLVTHDKGKVIVKGERDMYKLQVELPEDFPVRPNRDSKHVGVLRADHMDAAIARTINATDEASGRYALSGVMVETDGKQVEFVSTDGRRMHHCPLQWSSWDGPPPKDRSIIPKHSLVPLRRVLGSDEMSMVRVDISFNDVRFETEGWEFTTRLVEGTYPKWRDVFPKGERTEVDIPAGVLLSGVRKSAITATSESRGIDLIFTMGQLAITNATADIGSSRVEIPVSYVGDDMHTMLDSRFLQEYLAVLPPAETVTLSMGNSDGAFILAAGAYRAVVMPLAKE